ncbi:MULTISPECIES: NAD-dependent succinate-semialdehyde dehydrogenase [unclassified Corynebacterium]|uniref:NAD-dependent succinate-semialdehyde dehydrogenase n=1 Tax=unclassified Corynebacterium TaxID=2624378 RepID=UPI001EF65CE1|nr:MULTISPECIES: NAD-dependent succinate-semialdehyde dehydrogenase [unclassified Corynebacterium]MCG7233768.1 NAD-dependent succinate-semialdehyde dehydrogenase [Corynebacterium sp. ACRPR]MCG7243551.1 NAD-dependent succinate-semialdehyde dehydrogenase [Corynebacterium sp. ACRPS]MCG7271763.1 NAD-dependent succinate-semialdehyde dehydrogenase [Corynebacterium sp. ACRQM]MDK8659597.1 NAD-dependent succinate-semialdehyde dehydrogenase [Corynebacterium sp. MSK204]MDK8815408.1 NAD-dependent succinat
MSINIDEVIAKVPTQLLIGGEWRDSTSGETFDVENPATGETLATLSSANSDDAIAALDAACAVQDDWARTTPRERAEILRRAFDLVQERADEFAALMTLEMGKPFAEAKGEVTYGGEFLRWFSEEAVRDYGRAATVPEGTLRMITRRKPVGPCLLITPWNFPLAMATRKVAPAVAAGCTMVLKPAKLTPLTAQYFAQTMIDAGLPKGVLNVVAGKSASAISEPLLADDRLRKLSFTGSTPVGRTLLKGAADNVLRTSMELGGNAPFIVFEDADIDQAVQGAMGAKMRNIGEACTAANRFLVHESVAEEFSEKLVAEFEKLNLGNGMDEGITCGPLVESKALESIAALVDDAAEKGATIATGGKRGDGAGYFYEPTVITNVSRETRVAQEEIFGPVAPIITFSTEEEALEIANDTEYGLASYVFTENSDRLWRIADGLEFGLMGFNAGVISNAAAPFGGVKQSGMGREGGAEGIEEYTSVQYLGIRDPYANA